jgi:hypothetical protein
MENGVVKKKCFFFSLYILIEKTDDTYFIGENICLCEITHILFKQIRPDGIFGLVFLHLGLEGKGIASVFYCFDDVQQKYCLHLI